MTYRKEADIVVRDVAGETLLIPLKSKLADLQKLFVLEGAGKFIWDHVDGKNTVADLCAFVQDCYDISEETAGKDLDEFISGLQGAGLIVEV